MNENDNYEKKSLELLTKKNPDWNKLVKEAIAFANAQGGIIEIGIENDATLPPKDQKIPNTLINKIRTTIESNSINLSIYLSLETASNNGEYIKITVNKNRSTIASTTKGQFYMRHGEDCKPILPDELSILMNDKSSFVWELKQYLKIHKTNCDPQKLQRFLLDIRNSDRVKQFIKTKTDDEILEHYYLTENEHLTNLGVLWLGKRFDRANLKYAPTVQFIKYNEKQKKIHKILWDDYSLSPIELIEDIWSSIPDFRESIEFEDGIFREKIELYNEIVIRELLVNAIVHKPYTQRGYIFINLYPDRLEIHNPGLLPYGVTPKNILHKSEQRNQQLANIAHDLKLMEKEGSGYDIIYEKLLTSGKSLPKVEEGEDRVTVTIFNKIIDKNIIKFIEKTIKQFSLQPKEIIALSIISQKPIIKIKDLSEQLDQSESKIKDNWVNRLIDFNLINVKGKNKYISYSINPELLTNSSTNLSTIQSYRLKELIREDLRKHPNSLRNDIHQRIGREIPERQLRTYIKQLLDENEIIKEGKTRSTKYSIASI